MDGYQSRFCHARKRCEESDPTRRQKNERSYVDSEAKSVSVGKTKLYSITTNIVFGVKPSKKDKRPPKPKGAEYVIIVWVPSEAVSIKAAIAIGNQTISPNDCSTGHFSYCEFTVR